LFNILLEKSITVSSFKGQFGVYGHFGPKRLWTQDISALRPQRKNLRHLGTGAEMSWTLWNH